METKQKKFKSTYLLRVIMSDYNPFTPNVLFIDDQQIEFKRRNWYLISVDTNLIHFQNVIGISIDKHLIGASIVIHSSGNSTIKINGFSKKKANAIKTFCSKYISRNTQRGTSEVLSESIANAISQSNNAKFSVADEISKLKTLHDEGIISTQEFNEQRSSLLKKS